ncbi:MAG: hypothetical protein JST00_14250 [Deltaproteobacteria bacterium]|nr:hypothetical protein [Deltaproteobacteria bacterium]
MRVVILVGHGAPPTDCPPDLVARLKRLESERRRAKRAAPSDEEAELDARIRRWPRTDATDPYRAGVESLGRALSTTLGPGGRVVVAFNEFCAPSLEDAVAEAVAAGATQVTVVPTMLTRGGVHSEVEIPETIASLAQRFPELSLRYAWPFDDAKLAALLAAHPLVAG